MNVVLVTDVFLPSVSGVVTAVRNLAEGLTRFGHDVTLIAPGSPAARAWATKNKIALHPLRCLNLPCQIEQRAAVWTPKDASPVRAILKRADVVHLHSPFTGGLAVGRLARAESKPVIVTNHALPENIACALRMPVSLAIRFFGRILWTVIEYGVRLATLITAPTVYAAGLLLKRFGSININVISNGIMGSVPLGAPSVMGDDGNPIRAIYVGRLQREKRVDELLEGAAACWRSGVPIDLTIVGTGPDKKRLLNITKRLGLELEYHVKFVGLVDDTTRDLLYVNSHFLWIASRSELQCCSALEAMAAGIPVIGASAGALPETILDGCSGRLYIPGNAQQIADIMQEFKKNPQTYERMSRGARLVAAKHEVSYVCESITEAYHSVIA